MFKKAKKKENQFIIAVKDLADTKKALAEGTIKLPYDKSIYLDLIATCSNSVDNLKELRKFIRAQKKTKNEVAHYWEGLILDGFTLMEVHYESRNPTMEGLCNTPEIKLVCVV